MGGAVCVTTDQEIDFLVEETTISCVGGMSLCPLLTNGTRTICSVLRRWTLVSYVVLLGVCTIASPLCGDDGHRQISSMLVGGFPRPDLIVRFADSEDPSVRADAARAMGVWHEHVPDAMKLLRRLAHDDQRTVSLAAFEAAGAIGSRESLQAISGALDRSWSPTEAAKIVDALDTHSLRHYWKHSHLFGVHEQVSELAKMAERHHDLTLLLQVVTPMIEQDCVDTFGC